MESEELDSDELMEEGEEVVEEDTEDILGYLTPPTPVPPWLFDLLFGEMPLLQVGLSDPGRRDDGELKARHQKGLNIHPLGEHLPAVCKCALADPWWGLRMAG